MTAAEAKIIIAEMTKANNAFSKQVVGTTDLYIKNLIKAQDTLLKKISQTIAEAPDFGNIAISKRVAWYAGQTDRLNAMIKESGYLKTTANHIKQYEAFAKLAEQGFKAAGWDSAFCKVPAEYINFVQARDMKYFQFLGNEATAKIDNTLFEMSIGGHSRGSMLKELKGVITGEYDWGKKKGLYEWHAGTYARTQSSRTQQAFMNYQAEKVGAENFTYLGPFDGKVRPFCAGIIGAVFNKEEIMEMDNGQTGDVFSDGGGWNCRHQWLAVAVDLAANIEEMGKELKGLNGEEWVNSLSEAEHSSVASWVSGSSTHIRKYQQFGENGLRKYLKGKAFKGEYLETIVNSTKKDLKNLAPALNKAKPFDRVIYRGLHNLNKVDYKNMINSAELEWKAFSSATSDISVARKFALGKNSIIFEITPKTAVDIRKMSMFAESEVLMKPYTKYKVMSVNTDLKYALMRLEEI